MSNISNQINTEPPTANGSTSLSSDIVLLPNDYASLDDFQFQNIVQIKNHICGDVQHIQFASKLVDLAFDEIVSIRKFLMEVTSTLDKLKESVNDLLILCNRILEKIKLLSMKYNQPKDVFPVIHPSQKFSMKQNYVIWLIKAPVPTLTTTLSY